MSGTAASDGYKPLVPRPLVAAAAAVRVRSMIGLKLINLLPTMEFREEHLRNLGCGSGERERLGDDDDKVTGESRLRYRVMLCAYLGHYCGGRVGVNRRVVPSLRRLDGRL